MAALSFSGSLILGAATLAGSSVAGKVFDGGLVAPSTTLSATLSRGLTFSGSLFAPLPQTSAGASIPDPTAWDTDDKTWGQADFVYAEDKPVMLVESEFFQVDEGERFGDTQVDVVLTRTGLTIAGRDRQGQWKIDPTLVKEVTGIFPLIRAVPGTIVRVSIGSQETPDDAVRWEGPYDFICGVDFFKDFTVAGRYLAVRFESKGQPPWELLSYDLDLEPVGGR